MTVPAPPSGLATSPMTDAYARLAEVMPEFVVAELADAEPPPRGDGWAHAAALAAGGPSLDTFLAWDASQVEQDYGQRARPEVIASLALHRYAWPACLLFTVQWFLHRRVPRLSVGDVYLDRSAGRFAIRVGDFACLPGDPAAAHPGARVVADQEVLRAEVRDAVAAHLGPILEGFAQRARRGGRALWGMATDDFVEGLWHVAELLGEERRAIEELERLLPGGSRPFVGTAGFRELTGPEGAALSTRNRASCCLFYTVRPDDACGTCPRLCDGDRVRLLTSSV
jgi:FhuF-like iron-sulfur protein